MQYHKKSTKKPKSIDILSKFCYPREGKYGEGMNQRNEAGGARG